MTHCFPLSAFAFAKIRLYTAKLSFAQLQRYSRAAHVYIQRATMAAVQRNAANVGSVQVSLSRHLRAEDLSNLHNSAGARSRGDVFYTAAPLKVRVGSEEEYELSHLRISPRKATPLLLLLSAQRALQTLSRIRMIILFSSEFRVRMLCSCWLCGQAGCSFAAVCVCAAGWMVLYIQV